MSNAEELLKTLEGLMYAATNGWDMPDSTPYVKNARAAIAKARGQE